MSQALKKSAYGSELKYLDAPVLREAMRSAGNIVAPGEVSDTLSYVIKDGRYEDLHDLYLVLLSDDSVQQMKWDSPQSKKYFVATDPQSESIYGLMTANQHQLVEHSPAWASMSRYVGAETVYCRSLWCLPVQCVKCMKCCMLHQRHMHAHTTTCTANWCVTRNTL